MTSPKRTRLEAEVTKIVLKPEYAGLPALPAYELGEACFKRALELAAKVAEERPALEPAELAGDIRALATEELEA
jgi:hypothetical protein